MLPTGFSSFESFRRKEAVLVLAPCRTQIDRIAVAREPNISRPSCVLVTTGGTGDKIVWRGRLAFQLANVPQVMMLFILSDQNVRISHT